MVSPPDALRQEQPVAQRGRAADRFEGLTTGVWSRLPCRVRRWVPPTLIGFGVINGFTFTVDLVLLTILHQQLGLPRPAALTLGYGTAFTLAFVLNRWLNFRSHSPVGDQVGRYAVVVALNYTLLVVGLGTGLATLGVPLLLARVMAGVAEALWMYVAMRWWVFRGRPGVA